MPIYDFKCSDCGAVAEVLLHSSDISGVSCPDCGSANVERLLNKSYAIRTGITTSGTTCCGREERCDAPPCSTGGTCRKNEN
ncbi:MAG: FmdB family zinc ribbon protein [Dehalococcoidia bacterium]